MSSAHILADFLSKIYFPYSFVCHHLSSHRWQNCFFRSKYYAIAVAYEFVRHENRKFRSLVQSPKLIPIKIVFAWLHALIYAIILLRADSFYALLRANLYLYLYLLKSEIAG